MISREFENFQKFRQRKESGKMLQPQVNSKNLSTSSVHRQLLKLSFIIKQAVILWCAQNLKSIWCDMMSSQMNKDTTETAPEGYVGEILERLQNR